MYKEKAESLWAIIDDIDTLSDIIKPTNVKGYKLFYDAVMKKQSERHKYLTSYDGYTLVAPKHPTFRVCDECDGSGKAKTEIAVPDIPHPGCKECQGTGLIQIIIKEE